MVFNSSNGYKVKVKLFTVPGQVIHNATRRIVLQGVDAIAFIADSRRSATAENNLYWQNLHENMKEIGMEAGEVPVVIQYNKRDLPDSKTDEEIDATRKKGKEPIISAVAIEGVGVLETFFAVLQLAYRSIDAKVSLGRTVGLSERELLTEVFANIDTSGTDLAQVLPSRGGLEAR